MSENTKNVNEEVVEISEEELTVADRKSVVRERV